MAQDGRSFWTATTETSSIPTGVYSTPISLLAKIEVIALKIPVIPFKPDFRKN